MPAKKKATRKKVVRRKASNICPTCKTSNPASATKCKTCGAHLVGLESSETFSLPKWKGKQIDLHQKITFWKPTLPHIDFAQPLKPGSAPICNTCGASLTGKTYADISGFTMSQLIELNKHLSGHAEVLSAKAIAADAKARALDAYHTASLMASAIAQKTRVRKGAKKKK